MSEISIAKIPIIEKTKQIRKKRKVNKRKGLDILEVATAVMKMRTKGIIQRPDS